MSKTQKFLIFALIAVLAAVLQLKFKFLFGWTPDFLLVASVAASFYLKFPQILLFVLIGVWFLNWQPGLGEDMLFYAALPVAALFLEPLLPWRPWFANLALGVASIAVFYLIIAGYETVIAEYPVFLENIFWSSLFGFAAFKIFGIANR